MARVIRWHLLALLLLTVFAFVIRFWWLDRAPRGVLIDEGHFGYIAYSLLQTGKDEHGVPHPVIFRGFGDQKLPVYAYALVPIIKWLGLTTTATRLPSVIAGTLLVPAAYWLLRELKLSSTLSLLGALVVTVSPWTFMLSRFAFESNLALLFFTVGLAALVRALSHKPYLWLGITAATWALTWYTYIAYRPVTLGLAVVVLGFLVVKKEIQLKQGAFFFALFGLLIAPLFHPSLVQSGTARLEQVGIFSEAGIALEVDEKRTYCSEVLPSIGCYALWNKGTIVPRELISRFIHVYSPQFLITQGDGPLRYLSVEGFGQFFYVIYPLILFGLVALLFQVEGTSVSGTTRWLILAGLLIAPLPAVLSGDPQKVRISALLPFLLVTIVYGWQLFTLLLHTQLLRRMAAALFFILISVSSVSFLINFYTIHTVKHDLAYSSYVLDIFSAVDEVKTDNTKVFIKPIFSDPIMAYAYYKQVDPAHYQQAVQLGNLEPSGFQHAIALDNYFVSEDPMVNIGCKAVKEGYDALYITNEKLTSGLTLRGFTSTTGAVNYAYMYDAKQFALNYPEMCLD